VGTIIPGRDERNISNPTSHQKPAVSDICESKLEENLLKPEEQLGP
jgi:hypothetical protein